MNSPQNRIEKFLSGRYPYLWISLAILLIYGQTIFFGLTYSDDDYYVLKQAEFNSKIGNVPAAFTKGYADIYYRPIVVLSFMVNNWIAGTSPWVYHATNVLLHVSVSCVLFYLILVLGYSRVIGFVVSFIFAIHPLTSQAVAWIPGRNDALVALFVLLAFVFYLHWKEEGRKRFLVLHVLSFLCALLSKEIAVAFPLIIISYEFLRSQKKQTPFRWMSLIGCWSAILLGWFFIRTNAIAGATNPAIVGFEAFARNLGVIPDIWYKLLYPNLSPLSVVQYGSLMIIGFLAFIIGSLIRFRSSNEERKHVLFSLLWFLLFLLPAIFVRLRAADDFFDYLECRAYLPMIGMLFMLAGKRTGFTEWSKAGSMIAFIVFGLYFSIGNFFICRLYANRLSYFKAAVHHAGDRSIIRYQLGRAYQAAGNEENAMNEFNRAIELSSSRPDAYVDLGEILLRKGKISEAQVHVEKALLLNARHPLALTNLGVILYRHNHVDSAITMWKEAIRIDHALRPAYKNIFNHYFHIGRFGEAIEFVRALAERGINLPTDVAGDFLSFKNRVEGRVQFEEKHYEQATRSFLEALKYDPENADTYVDLGAVYFITDDVQKGIVANQKALKLNPKHAQAHTNLGLAFIDEGMVSEAETEWRKAIAADSSHSAAYDRLIRLYLSTERKPQANQYANLLRRRGIPITKELELLLQ